MSSNDNINPNVVRKEGQVITGNVKAWVMEKGYGFVTADDSGPDIFVHQSSIIIEDEGYRCIMPNTRVECHYHLREGKHTATRVTAENGEPLKSYKSRMDATMVLEGNKSLPEGTFSGRVKWFNVQKGFGFINPDDGGKEIFVHIGDVQGMIPLVEDEPVNYGTYMKDGKPRANHVVKKTQNQGLLNMPMGMGMGMGGLGGMGGMGMGMGMGGLNMMGMGMGGMNMMGLGGVSMGGVDVGNFGGEMGFENPSTYGGSYASGTGGGKTGVCKWYNEPKGFGFIVPNNGGKDVYFRGTSLANCQKLDSGDPVEYEEKVAEGKMWAVNIQSTKNRKRKGFTESLDQGFKQQPRNNFGVGVPQQQGQGQYWQGQQGQTNGNFQEFQGQGQGQGQQNFQQNFQPQQQFY